jgi:hypothetical protein
MHDDRHEHEHSRGHEHEHDHSTAHPGAKTEAVLEYTLAHNEQHADELTALADKLRAGGLAAAASAVDAAVLDFRSGNGKLSEALRSIKEGC